MKLSFVCAVVMLLAGVGAASAGPDYRFKIRNATQPTASIVALKGERRTVFVVTDARGIGGVTISTTGRWPRNVALRFQYAKQRGFRTLEGWEMTTASLRVEGSQRDSGAMRFYLPDADGNFAPGEPPAGELRVLVEERDGALEVTLPPNLLAASKAVTIAWVDAFR